LAHFFRCYFFHVTKYLENFGSWQLFFLDIYKADGLSCWGGSYIHDFDTHPGEITPCWYTADTCKSVITYSSGFRNFPDMKASCVEKATDGPYGCSDCTNSSCSFIVYNSLTDVIVKTRCDSTTNHPEVQSCFNGTLTTSSQKVAPCVPPTIYCQVDLKSQNIDKNSLRNYNYSKKARSN